MSFSALLVLRSYVQYSMYVYPFQIFSFYVSWKCFMYGNSELSCFFFFYNGSQWVFMIFPLSETGGSFEINPDLRMDPNSVP